MASRAERTRRPRVLVIDDEPSVREIWCEFLRALGCDADPMADGSTGLAALGRGGYDLVIADLIMPGLGGRAVARAVQHLDPTLGIILVTGDLEAEASGEPGIALLTKPVGFGEFRRAVENCLAPRLAEPAGVVKA